MVKNLPAMQEIWVRPVGGKIPWRRKWQPTAVVLPARSHGQRSLVGYSPRGHKELGMTERVTTQNVKHCFRTLESDLRSKKWRDLTLERRGTALGEIPMSVACQTPLSMGFFRQEYCSGLPFPSPGHIPDPGMEPGSLASQEPLSITSDMQKILC